MARHIQDQDSKKYHRLQALHGKALHYINMGMTPVTTHDKLWAMLDQRYDDPMAFNYNAFTGFLILLKFCNPN